MLSGPHEATAASWLGQRNIKKKKWKQGKRVSLTSPKFMCLLNLCKSVKTKTNCVNYRAFLLTSKLCYLWMGRAPYSEMFAQRVFYYSLCVSTDVNSKSARVLVVLVVPGHLIFLYTIHLLQGGHTAMTSTFIICYLSAALLQVR